MCGLNTRLDSNKQAVQCMVKHNNEHIFTGTDMCKIPDRCVVVVDRSFRLVWLVTWAGSRYYWPSRWSRRTHGDCRWTVLDTSSWSVYRQTASYWRGNRSRRGWWRCVVDSVGPRGRHRRGTLSLGCWERTWTASPSSPTVLLAVSQTDVIVSAQRQCRLRLIGAMIYSGRHGHVKGWSSASPATFDCTSTAQSIVRDTSYLGVS